jgi:hypothetical protein
MRRVGIQKRSKAKHHSFRGLVGQSRRASPDYVRQRPSDKLHGGVSEAARRRFLDTFRDGPTSGGGRL